MKSLYIPFSDNGHGLCHTQWARSLFTAGMSGAFGNLAIVQNYFASPYPNVICNFIANDFMATKCDALLLIDLDVIFTPADIRMLLSHDLPYVGGIICKRQLGKIMCINPHEPLRADPFAEGVNPLVSADFGRGFCVIKREVFELVGRDIPDYEDTQTEGAIRMKEYFTYKPGGHSEDFAFCEKYRALGGNPVIDQRITCLHEGMTTFPIPGTY